MLLLSLALFKTISYYIHTTAVLVYIGLRIALQSRNSGEMRLRDFKYRTLGISAPLKPLYNDPCGSKPWTEVDTLLYLRQTRALTQTILQDLSDMTDLGQTPLEPPRIRCQMSSLDHNTLQFSSHGSPVVGSRSTLHTTLQKLTFYRYNAADQLKVTDWLHKITRYISTMGHDPQMSTMCTSLIGFFLSTNDLQMAFYILDLMRVRKLTASRSTLHYFLQYNVKYMSVNPYYRDHVGHPLINVKSCLSKLKAMDVLADQLTWNLVLQCMPFGFGKSFLVEEMDKRGIPLNVESRMALVKTILKDRKANETQSLLTKLDPEDPVVIQAVIDKLLAHKVADNANVVRAWEVFTASNDKDTSTDMLNIFLRRFAARRHFDWQLGVLQHFPNTEWNEETWQYLLEAAVFGFDTPSKPAVLGTLLKEAERSNVYFTPRARYLARRAQRYTLTDMGGEAWLQLKSGLQWIQALKPHKPELLSLIGFDKNGTPAQSAVKSEFQFSVRPVNLDVTRFEGLPRTDSFARKPHLTRQLASK